MDALRVSAEIAGQAYDELIAEIRLFGDKSESDRKGNSVRAVRHAWTFIDAVHRFRVVLQQTPHVKHNPVYELFMRRTETVTEMRNKAQHLNHELARIAERGQGAYGTLTWVLGVGEDRVPRPMMINVGTAYGRVVGPVVDFEERLPIGELRRVRLELADGLLTLSETWEHVHSMVRSLEAPLAEFAEGKGAYGSDQVMSFDFVPVKVDHPEEGDI